MAGWREGGREGVRGSRRQAREIESVSEREKTIKKTDRKREKNVGIPQNEVRARRGLTRERSETKVVEGTKGGRKQLGGERGREEEEEEGQKTCETFNRQRAAGPPRETAEREALEKPVGANLFYFEYKVDDEIFSPPRGKSAR